MSKSWMINGFLKKILKVLHIVSIACVTGGLVSMLTLLLVKLGLRDLSTVFYLDFAMLKLFSYVVTISSFVLVTTSFLYELFTEWGLFRFYWMLAKWLIVIMIFTITWVGLGPAIGGLTSLSDAGFHITTQKVQYDLFSQKALLFLILELLLLMGAFILSILKPWGKREGKKPINRKTILLLLIPVLLIGVAMPIMQSVNLDKIRRMEIQNESAANLPDGIYYGEAEVGNYAYKVNVTVKDERIISIESVEPRNSPYVNYAEGVFDKIIRDQNASTDAITGATTTSKAYMKAVENALSTHLPSKR